MAIFKFKLWLAQLEVTVLVTTNIAGNLMQVTS
jgi:hypothetical protein